MKYILLFIFFVSFLTTFSQDTSDVYRLKKMDYMKHRNQFDCNNTSGDNLSHKICLNVKFQEVDSVLNTRIVSYAHNQKDSRTKSKIMQQHKRWIIYRRNKAEEQSEGLSGHMTGIYYLSTMIKLTELKIEELDFYLNN